MFLHAFTLAPTCVFRSGLGHMPHICTVQGRFGFGRNDLPPQVGHIMSMWSFPWFGPVRMFPATVGTRSTNKSTGSKMAFGMEVPSVHNPVMERVRAPW